MHFILVRVKKTLESLMMVASLVGKKKNERMG